MSKPRVPDSEKRVVCGARITPYQKKVLVAAGHGNISRGFDRVFAAVIGMWAAAPAMAIPPDIDLPTPAGLESRVE
jgi:hypothetical protein